MTPLVHEAASTVRLAARVGKVGIGGTTLHVWEDEYRDEDAMMPVLRSVVKKLRALGFAIGPDPQFSGKNHAHARRGDIELIFWLAGRHLEIKIYQGVVREPSPHPHGPRYEHNQELRFPRRMRLEVAVLMAALVERLVALGYALGDGLTYPLPRAILRHWDKSHAFDRLLPGETLRERLGDRGSWWWKEHSGPDGWLTDEFLGWQCRKDREGVTLRNGMERWCRVGGRLFHGRVYAEANQHWIIERNGIFHRFQAHQMFTATDKDFAARRLVPDQLARLKRECKESLEKGDYPRLARVSAALVRLQENGRAT